MSDKVNIWSNDESDEIGSFESPVLPEVGSKLLIVDQSTDTINSYTVEGQTWHLTTDFKGETTVQSVDIEVKKNGTT